MFDTFSPFHPLIFAVVLVGLLVFYLTGSFFTPRLCLPGRNIAARCTMGALVFTTFCAVTHAGLKTMLLPFALWLAFVFAAKPKGLKTDLKAICTKHWVLLVVSVAALLIAEMSFSDLREGSDIIIGNWDYASSGGLGYDFYSTSPETMRFLWNHQANRAFHHHADYWFAGFFSNYLGILPYYSYILVYRLIFEILLALLLIAWIAPLIRSRLWFALLLPVFVLLVSGLQYLPGLNSQENWADLFPVVDILWNCVPYLFAAVAILLFSMMVAEGVLFHGLVGLMLVPLLHPGIALIAPAAAVFLIFIKFLSQRVNRIGRDIPLSYLQLNIILMASMSAYVFGSIDGRMYAMPLQIFRWNYVFETFTTILLTLLSSLYFLPFIGGIWYLFFTSSSRLLFWVHAGLYLGALVSFSLIFPLMGGNSEQIMIMYVTALLIPTGSIGLFAAVFSANKWYRAIAVAALFCSLLAGGIHQNEIRNGGTLKQLVEFNLGFDEEWKTKSRISAQEAHLFRARLADKPLTDIGIVILDDSINRYKETIFLQYLPYLRGILPGAEFHRLDILPQDTFQGILDMPRTAFFKRSTLYHFFTQTTDTLTMPERMANFIKPSYLLLDTTNPAMYVPASLAKTYTHYDTLGRFILVSAVEN